MPRRATTGGWLVGLAVRDAVRRAVFLGSAAPAARGRSMVARDRSVVARDRSVVARDRSVVALGFAAPAAVRGGFEALDDSGCARCCWRCRAVWRAGFSVGCAWPSSTGRAVRRVRRSDARPTVPAAFLARDSLFVTAALAALAAVCLRPPNDLLIDSAVKGGVYGWAAALLRGFAWLGAAAALRVATTLRVIARTAGCSAVLRPATGFWLPATVLWSPNPFCARSLVAFLGDLLTVWASCWAMRSL